MFEIAIGVPLPFALEGALAAAVRSRDADMVRRAIAAIEEDIPANGRLGIALRRLGEGALVVLDGDRDRGAEILASGLGLLVKVGVPLDIADWQTAFAALVGLDHPAALEAATAAQEWISEVGAYGLERIWGDGLPGEVVDVEKSMG